MKRLLLFALTLCGRFAFAVAPVAVWNGDLRTGSVKADKYTMTSESSVVMFADGVASLTKTTSVQSKGVEISWGDPASDSTLPQNQITVFVKYSGYNADSGNHSLVSVLWGNTTTELVVYGTSGKNRIRSAHSVGTSGSGTQDNADANGIQQAIPTEGILMVSLAGVNGELSGTRVAIAAKSGDSYGDFTQYYYNSGYKFSSSLFYGVRIGGTQTGTGNYYRPSLTVEGVAIYSTGTSVATANAQKDSLFPAPESPKVEPLMLLNVHNGTAVAGWLNHTQDGGGVIPNAGSLETNGISFVTTNDRNFFYQRDSGADFQQGNFVDMNGKSRETIADEVRASLLLPDDIAFDRSVYASGVMNGGGSGHTATLSGLDDAAKYVLYVGCGRDHKDGNYTSGFKFETSGCASVEELAYVNTDSTAYQTGRLDNDMLSTTDGLLIVRAKGIKSVNGTIQFKMVGARSSLNFLAIAKVNETTVYTTKEIAGGASISVSEINAKIEETNDKAEVTLDPGAVVTYDAALKVPTKFIASGSITLSHETQPDLAKADFSGVAGIVKRDWVKKGFGFNFNNNVGGTTTIALENTTWKSDASGNNGTNVAMSEDGISKVTWSSNNVYTDQQNTGTILHGYLDDSAGVNITVSNIPFAEYAVIIYSTTDTENAKLSYKTVNGKDYTADGTKDVAKEGTEAWGRSRSSAAAAYGTNALRIVAQTSGSLVIHSANRSGARGCISAIQIVPYTTAVAPSLVEGKTVEVAVETDAEIYAGGRVTLTIPEGAVDLGTYTEDQVSYKLVFAGKVDAVAGEKQKDGTVAFVLPDTEYVVGHVYRGQVVLDYGEGETPLGSVAVYEGERQYKWIASPFVVKEKTTIDDAQGCTINPIFDSPDYVENCDSRYTVSISAREAIDESLDEPLAGNEQGGVRIVQTAGGLKLQGLVKPEDGASAWTNLADAELDKEYVVTVTFHYTKDFEGEREPTSVSYQLGETNVSGVNPTAKLNVSEIFISDGTKLPSDLLGACQLDVAVIVDLEIEPGDELLGLGETEEAAEAAAAKLKVGIGEAVRKVLTTAEAQESYRAYFMVVAVKTDLGYVAQVVFKPEVESEIETELKKELEKVVAAFNAGSAAEIAAKPGLYYGVKRGDALDDMAVRDPLTLAGADGKVTITITKPEKSNGHFYRLICTPTPAEEK